MMKRKQYFLLGLSFSAMLCCIAIIAKAQAGKKSILRTGPGVSFFTNDKGTKSIPAFGFSIGLSPTLPLGKQIYLKPEIDISKKGGRLDYDIPGIYTGNVKYRIYYLDFPVMAGIRLNSWMALEAGVYGALRLSGNFDFQGTFSTGYGVFDRDDLKPFDYGAVTALIFQSRVASIGLRYSHGLSPVATSGNNNAALLLGNATNNTLQFCIQKMRLRKKRK